MELRRDWMSAASPASRAAWQYGASAPVTVVVGNGTVGPSSAEPDPASGAPGVPGVCEPVPGSCGEALLVPSGVGLAPPPDESSPQAVSRPSANSAAQAREIRLIVVIPPGWVAVDKSASYVEAPGQRQRQRRAQTSQVVDPRDFHHAERLKVVGHQLHPTQPSFPAGAQPPAPAPQ